MDKLVFLKINLQKFDVQIVYVSKEIFNNLWIVINCKSNSELLLPFVDIVSHPRVLDQRNPETRWQEGLLAEVDVSST